MAYKFNEAKITCPFTVHAANFSSAGHTMLLTDSMPALSLITISFRVFFSSGRSHDFSYNKTFHGAQFLIGGECLCWHCQHNVKILCITFFSVVIGSFLCYNRGAIWLVLYKIISNQLPMFLLFALYYIRLFLTHSSLFCDSLYHIKLFLTHFSLFCDFPFIT